LRRMDGANVDALVQKIRGQIRVLSEVKTQVVNGQEAKAATEVSALAAAK
jgi:hypothetical protein